LGRACPRSCVCMCEWCATTRPTVPLAAPVHGAKLAVCARASGQHAPSLHPSVCRHKNVLSQLAALIFTTHLFGVVYAPFDAVIYGPSVAQLCPCPTTRPVTMCTNYTPTPTHILHLPDRIPRLVCHLATTCFCVLHSWLFRRTVHARPATV
jgi:hypothetical protein